jgi:hypothetical protein
MIEPAFARRGHDVLILILILILLLIFFLILIFVLILLRFWHATGHLYLSIDFAGISITANPHKWSFTE